MLQKEKTFIKSQGEKTFEKNGDVYIYVILPKYNFLFYFVLPCRGYRRCFPEDKICPIYPDLQIQRVVFWALQNTESFREAIGSVDSKLRKGWFQRIRRTHVCPALCTSSSHTSPRSRTPRPSSASNHEAPAPRSHTERWPLPLQGPPLPVPSRLQVGGAVGAVASGVERLIGRTLFW